MKIVVKNIILDDKFLLIEEENGSKSKIFLENIIKIFIETNDLGPFENDLYLILLTETDEIVIPENTGILESLMGPLIDYFHGFNEEIFIKAISSARNELFVVWSK